MHERKQEAIRLALDPDYVIDQVKEYFNPEDVFDEDQLKSWAEDNGYTLEKSE